MAGGMMRYGIPKYRLPRDVLDAEVQRILDLGVRLELDAHGHRPAAVAATGLRRRLPRCRRAARPACLHPRRVGGPRARRRLDAARRRERRAAAAGPPGRGVRRRQHRDGRGPHRASGSAPRRRSSSTAAPRTGCPPTSPRSREAEEEGVLFKWLTTIKQVDAGTLAVERMELDETGFPQPTGELEELAADALVLALGQETDLSLLDGVPGLVVEDGVVAVGPDMMTGSRRGLRRRRHGARRALGDRRDRARQAGGPQHRRLAVRRAPRRRAAGRRWRPSTR